MDRLSIENQTTLDRLNLEIKRTYQESIILAAKAREQCNAAVAAAILCGQALARAKEIVGHGGWMEWVKKHRPEIPHRTVTRYIKLANWPHVANLEKATSLRQAYITAGIIPEDEKPAAKPPAPAGQNTITKSAAGADTRAPESLAEARSVAADISLEHEETANPTATETQTAAEPSSVASDISPERENTADAAGTETATAQPHADSHVEPEFGEPEMQETNWREFDAVVESVDDGNSFVILSVPPNCASILAAGDKVIVSHPVK